MAAFLVKTEPSTYSFENLTRDRKTVWDGVSNPVALRHLATIRKGDEVVVYHTGKEKAAVGLATAASDAYPDPKSGDPKLVVVELEADRPLAEPVPLSTFKSDPVLQTVAMVRMPRLSVMPLSAAQLQKILEHAGA